MKRVAWRKLHAVIVALALATLATLAPRPPDIAAADVKAPAKRHILIISNEIHTDIAIPIGPDIQDRFSFLEQAGIPLGHPDARWLIFGWGGREFYLETPTWFDLKPLPLFKALTLDSSVMHVEIAGSIDEPHPAVVGLDIGEAGYERLVKFIAGSFENGSSGPILVPDRSYGENDRFYEAKGFFNAFVGCNSWTAGALREAGLKTGWWTPLPATLGVTLSLYN